MALQRAKASLISAKLGWSASRSAPSVSSENTTPQPKVASGALRSRTVTSWAGEPPGGVGGAAAGVARAAPGRLVVVGGGAARQAEDRAPAAEQVQGGC